MNETSEDLRARRRALLLQWGPLGLALQLGVGGGGGGGGQQNLTANITSLDCALALANSTVGPVDVKGLALLVSCVGRKLVMGDQVDDEILAVADQVGAGFTLTGFYSYGEICPMEGMKECKLHNQTMTVTLLTES